MSGRGVCRFTLMLTVVLFSLSPKIAFSLGFGQIKLSSYLNEPLKAEIELLGIDEVDPSQLIVSLASADDFKKVQLARPFLLTQMKFQVLTENDKFRIIITTTDAIKQPSLEFLVVLSWAEGRLVRGYTLLLDPAPLEPATSPDLALNDKNLENLFETNYLQPAPKSTEPPIVLSQAVSIESSNTPTIIIPPAETIPLFEKAEPIATPEVIPEPLPITFNFSKKWLAGSGVVLFLICSFVIFRRVKNTTRSQHLKKTTSQNIELFDQEIKIKLELATQYFSIQDLSSAQELLVDILSRGNLQEKAAAKDLLEKISLCR